MKVFLSPTAKQALEERLDYLLLKWSGKVKQEFIERLDAKINQIAHYPKAVRNPKYSKAFINASFPNRLHSTIGLRKIKLR